MFSIDDCVDATLLTIFLQFLTTIMYKPTSDAG